jgi:hypothetical protein
LHFKNYDHPEFYKWAKTYIDKNTSDFRDFNQIEFTPLQDADFGIWVNSIFDIMYHANQHAYINLKNNCLMLGIKNLIKKIGKEENIIIF